MARQRFIWPTIWADPEFGRLKDSERILFIGLFSNADDEGRLLADPSYLRSIIWPYEDNLTGRKVRGIRDAVVSSCDSICLYEVDGIEYIALRKWESYQHPKYPKPSAHPPPPSSKNGGTFTEDSSNIPPQGWVGKGRDGLGRDKNNITPLIHSTSTTDAPRARDLEMLTLGEHAMNETKK